MTAYDQDNTKVSPNVLERTVKHRLELQRRQKMEVYQLSSKQSVIPLEWTWWNGCQRWFFLSFDIFWNCNHHTLKTLSDSFTFFSFKSFFYLLSFTFSKVQNLSQSVRESQSAIPKLVLTKPSDAMWVQGLANVSGHSKRNWNWNWITTMAIPDDGSLYKEWKC